MSYKVYDFFQYKVYDFCQYKIMIRFNRINIR